MTKISAEAFLVLKPTSRSGLPVNGQRPVREFKIEKLTQNKPFTNRDEVAVRVTVAVDSTLFDSLIPHVEIELGEKDLFVNTRVEVQTVEADQYEQTGE